MFGMRFRHNVAVASLVFAAAGCAPSEVYTDGPKPQASSVSPRSRWQASGDLRDVQKAIDGSLATAAVSPSTYHNAQITIDLGKSCVFNFVAIDHGADELGFCRRVAVLVSQDGKNFAQVEAVPGTRRVTVINLVSPVLARYVRLVAVVPGDRPWSIAEIYIQ